jgi:hypothetical protein
MALASETLCAILLLSIYEVIGMNNLEIHPY